MGSVPNCPHGPASVGRTIYCRDVGTFIQLPIFPSSDFDATVELYSLIDFNEGNRFGEQYLIIDHPLGLELHFFPAKVKPRSNDHMAYIRFEALADLDALAERWAGLTNTPAFARAAGKIGRLHAPVDTDYGLREFALVDADGNLLRIGGPLTED